MSRILVLHSSFDGQSRRIALRIGDILWRRGHAVTARSADAKGAFGDLGLHDAIVICAAVRYGRYARGLEADIRENHDFLASMPNAFVSVCLSVAGSNAKAEVFEAPIRALRKRTGWNPAAVTTVAGALPYRRYNPFTRLMMRFIVGRAGGDTDTSRDYEYTDWAAVDRFAEQFARDLAPHAMAA